MHAAVQESALESHVKVPSTKFDSNDEISPQLKDVAAAVVIGAAVVETTGRAAVVVTTGGEGVVEATPIPDFTEKVFYP